jgi:predicted Zn-dependent protease
MNRCLLHLLLGFALLIPVAAEAGNSKKSATSAGSGTAEGARVPSEDPSDPVLAAMEAELARAQLFLSKKEADPPYFIGLQIIELSRISVVAEEGAIQGHRPSRARIVHADVRVGDPRLDSTHPLREGGSADDASGGHPLGIGDDPEVLARAIWKEIDASYRAAVDRWQRVVSDRQVLVDEEPSWDLAPTSAEQELHPAADLADVDVAAWEEAARHASAVFGESTITLDPSVSIYGEAETRWFVSSEGHRIREGLTRFRASVSVDTQASDGTLLGLYTAWDSAAASGLPSAVDLRDGALALEADLVALKSAPEQGPYRGPALLSGRVSAVFFHEIFGHRVEGHRLKQVEDAQTFRNQVGEEILPSFLSVYDDPTRATTAGRDLRGFYRFDDQGVRARRVTLVEDGVLRGFLESRSPVSEEGQSNGHGRRQMGHRVVSRQGNLLIESKRQVSDAELRRRLVAAAKKDRLSYGLRIEDIGGGFTFTARDLPNAFQIDVLQAYRVFVDGRPDELVRGIDLIGTPLATFSKITDAGPTVEVFNGTCGAESGWVPVSASAPALLVSQIETQRKAKGQQRPPLSPPPGPAALLDAELAKWAQTEALGDDPLLAVLISELERASATLRMPDLPGPAWITATVFDGDAHRANADFGALGRSWGTPGRPARLEVVVGDEALNSSRIDGGGMAGLPASVMNPRFVLGDQPLPIARDLWLTADASYKAALQRFAVKLAARRSLQDDDAPPDWSAAPPVVYTGGQDVPAIEPAAIEQLAVELSAAFRPFGDELRIGQVMVGEAQGRSYFVDSLGSRIVQPEGYVAVYAHADLVRPDGLRVFDRRVWVARSRADLPSLAEMEADVEDMTISLLLRARSQTVDYYEGPVVFEGEAAASFLRYLVPPELRGTPPQPETDRSYQELTRGGPRLGRRLLPRGWTVFDDPRSVPARLAGGFRYDREGVAASYVELIRDGYVRNFVMSRVPRADIPASNGHARGSIGGVWQGRLSNWTVRPKRLLRDGTFRRRVQAHRRAADVPAVLVVRRLEQGWEGGLPRPTDAVWRYPDGTELPVVSLEFQEVDRRSLRSIAAAGGQMQTHSYLATASGWGRAGTVDGIPMVLSCPGRLLIPEVEVAFPGGGADRARYPQPSVGAGQGEPAEPVSSD